MPFKPCFSNCDNYHTVDYHIKEQPTGVYHLCLVASLLFACLLPKIGVAEEGLVPSLDQHASNSQQVPLIIVLGDSLSAGFGVEQGKGWVNLLQTRLKQNRYPHQVINASISGETTSGGLSRIAGLLSQHTPDIVLIELGGNDGLRGLPLKLIRTNLGKIVQAALDKKTTVLLIGMQLPPNYGITYTKQFAKMYDELAQQYQVALVPFLMQGFASNLDLIQADGIHPKTEAQGLMLDNVWPHLQPLMKDKQPNFK